MLRSDVSGKKEIDQFEKYVGGLPDTIHGSVMATKPKTMQDAIEFATELMDKKINTWAERQADNKESWMMTPQEQTRIRTKQETNTGRSLCEEMDVKEGPYGGPQPLAFQEGLPKIKETTQWGNQVEMAKTKTSQRGNDLKICLLFKNFLIFSLGLAGIPPTRQGEFQSIGYRSDTPVTRAHIVLAPSGNEGN
ncbi:hypothetical protein Tco_1571067 [Tanacetum coccineum]